MRLLITTTYFKPYISGVTEYMENLAKGLIANGHEVDILTMKYANELPEHDNYGGINVNRVKPLFKVSKGYMSIAWMWASYRYVNKANVVVVNLPGPESLITTLWSKLTRKKLLAIYHCDVVINNKFIESILDFCHFWIMLWADKIITNTKDYAENSRLLPKFLKKASYIYPIIRETSIKKYSHKMFTIGWIGRIAREKGIEFLLEAIPYLKNLFKENFKIVIAGPMWVVGEDVYRKKIMEMLGKYNEHIQFWGELDTDKILLFYGNIDVLVVSSTNATETLGLVQLEAMMQGIPVVATDLPGVRQPIKQTGLGIIVKPKNAREIALAIYKIYQNNYKFKQNFKAAAQYFSPQKGINEFEHLILS